MINKIINPLFYDVTGEMPYQYFKVFQVSAFQWSFAFHIGNFDFFYLTFYKNYLGFAFLVLIFAMDMDGFMFV